MSIELTKVSFEGDTLDVISKGNAASRDELRSCWVVTNPPFRLGPQRAQTVLQHSCMVVVPLFRCTFLDPCKNHLWLIDLPPTYILSLSHLSFKWNAKTDFIPTCWFVWVKDQPGTIQLASRFDSDSPQIILPKLTYSKGGINTTSERSRPPFPRTTVSQYNLEN